MFRKSKNILITGSKGQLGSYLERYFRKQSLLKKSCIGKVFGIDKDDLDIRNNEAVKSFFNGKSSSDVHVHFDYVIHCAAATDTTAIEKDPYGESYDVNVIGAKNIAEACAMHGSKMIFISTDYVMSEHSKLFGKIYDHPVNQYGMQKLLAEQMVKNAFKNKEKDLLIARSSWMFGNSHKSFVEKIMSAAFKLYASNRDKDSIELKVADDAYGRPTLVHVIAALLNEVISSEFSSCIPRYGICDLDEHSNSPVISRSQWAKIIVDEFCKLMKDKEFSAKFNLKLDIYDFSKKIHVAPTHSSELGLSMRHPGYVPCYVKASTSNDNELAEYIYYTHEYICNFAEWFVDEANAAIDAKE